MKLFHIVTPSFNQLEWLRFCMLSVQDQCGSEVAVHHHVQDACSTDGTPEFLRKYAAGLEREPVVGYSFSFASEKDGGMYDAINRGWKLAAADSDFVAHLNCDEQYLPGALARVAAELQRRPLVDVLLADVIVVDEGGGYICHRRSLRPFRLASRFCCAGFTASVFQRVAVTRDKGVFFDTSWRNFGDKVWYNALHRAGVRFGIMNEPTSVFTDTGKNLNWTDEGLREKRRYEQKFQFGSSLGSTVIAKINATRRLVKELQIRSPTAYAIYTRGSEQRTTFRIENPTGHWHKRWPQKNETTDYTDIHG